MPSCLKKNKRHLKTRKTRSFLALSISIILFLFVFANFLSPFFARHFCLFLFEVFIMWIIRHFRWVVPFRVKFLRDTGEQRGAELHALAIILEDEIFRNFFLQILSTTLQLSFPVLSLSLSYLTDELARKRDAQLQKASSPLIFI